MLHAEASQASVPRIVYQRYSIAQDKDKAVEAHEVGLGSCFASQPDYIIDGGLEIWNHGSRMEGKVSTLAHL